MRLFRRKPPQRPLRTGVLRTTLSGTGLFNKGQEYDVVYELAEWERLSFMSRVTVVKVSGLASESERRQASALLPDWIDSQIVTWRRCA